VSRLRSGAFGYFFVIAQVMVAEGSRATYEKAGMWDAERQRILGDGVLQGCWQDLSPGEKHSVLAYFHEQTHHTDVTSLPAGAFYWRIWDVVREYGERYVEFLRELDLAGHVDGPLKFWLRTDKAKRLVAKQLSRRALFCGYHLDRVSRAAIRRDYCGAFLDRTDSLHRVAKSLFQDNMPDFERYGNDLNLAAEEIHARFLVESPPLFGAIDYERVPQQQWVDDDAPRPEADHRYFLSLLDILELRAYAKELRILQLVKDPSFFGDVLARAAEALSANAVAVLSMWVEKGYDLLHLRYITDLALGGLIDPNCCYYVFTDFMFAESDGRDIRPTTKVEFRRNWPSHRMAALLTMLADDWTVLVNPNMATPRYYTEVGQYLFGSETYPFTGMSLSQRSMIPRCFRGPMESPLPRDGRWDAAHPFPLADILVGKKRSEWKPEMYLEELNGVFACNQSAYLLSFCRQAAPGFIEPQTYVLSDCVVGASRSPFLGDSTEADRARLYATQSLLRNYVGAIFATELLEDHSVRIQLGELIGGWGDAEWLLGVREKLGEVYGAPMMERFFS
jgi:hypothetical protein